MKRPLLVLSFLILTGLSGATAEDLTLVTTSTAMGKTTTGTQLLGEKKMRINDGAGSDMIFDYDTGTLTTIDHKKKNYWQATLAQIRAQMEQMANILENNPVADGLLGEIGDVTVDEMGESKTIAGHGCKMMVMKMGETFTTEMCVSEDLAPPVSYYQARQAMTAMMGPMAKRFEKMYEEMSEIDGMALETVSHITMMGRSMDTTTRVTEVKVGPLPSDAFDIPSNYKKKKSPFE